MLDSAAANQRKVAAVTRATKNMLLKMAVVGFVAMMLAATCVGFTKRSAGPVQAAGPVATTAPAPEPPTQLAAQAQQAPRTAPVADSPTGRSGWVRLLWWIGGALGVLVALVLALLIIAKIEEWRVEAHLRPFLANPGAALRGEDVVCPRCGTVYNRAVVVRLLKEQSPEIFLAAYWTTKFVCKQCRAHLIISGVGGE